MAKDELASNIDKPIAVTIVVTVAVFGAATFAGGLVI